MNFNKAQLNMTIYKEICFNTENNFHYNYYLIGYSLLSIIDTNREN